MKQFIDGQRLCIENSQKKQEDAVAMISSQDIAIYPKNYAFRRKSSSLIGTITSIETQNSDDSLIVEVIVSGVKLSSKLSKKELLYYKLIPGEKAVLQIDTSKICWL